MFSATLLPGVELRLLEERHAPALFALMSREQEHLRQWLTWACAIHSEDDVLAFIRRGTQHFSANEGFTAGIWAEASLAGCMDLRVNQVHRNAEIGYWLAREFQGRGIVTTAVRAVTAYALVELDLNRVEIRSACGNSKSSAIPKRLGFTREGVLRESQCLNGVFLDLEVYSMLRREYRR